MDKLFTSVRCRSCRKAFAIRKYRIKEGRGKYCSRRCTPLKSIGKKLGQYNKGKKLSLIHRNNLSVARLNSDKVRGKNHWKWRGGKWHMATGYILILKPDHPSANTRGYIMEHRLIMEKKIGRYLTKNEVVHHKNHIKSDNRIINLILFTIKQHKSLEGKIRWDKYRKELTKCGYAG